MLRLLLFSALPLLAMAQVPDPVHAPLEQAYSALKAKNYDAAVNGFQAAISLAPDRAAIRKDLAYTFLKIGENEAAREQFGAAMRLDPADVQPALEYAFLCYELKRQGEARRIFDRIRKTGNATAETAFQNIDKPLAAGIQRWTEALAMSPDNFSAHRELAELSEQRDDAATAAAHYEAAWRLRPDETELLLDLGRNWRTLGQTEQAVAALIAASRSRQPRIAEKARELLPERYPYVYEFEKALALDPRNRDLRRELGFLLLEMGKSAEAERQFEQLHALDPGDLLTAAQLGFLRLKRGDAAGGRPLLEAVIKGGDEALAGRARQALGIPETLKTRTEAAAPIAKGQARELGEKSLAAGYLKDAARYLAIAHEQAPDDFGLALKLGWTYNTLHDDEEAVRWFKLAKTSPDAAIAREANTAYNNLRSDERLLRSTGWLYPIYSSRWRDAFGYAQFKTEMRVGHLPLWAYASTRFVGDVRGSAGTPAGYAAPQYLSESSFILGGGLRTSSWHGVTGWAEAGESIKYLSQRKDVGAMVPDYRGGLAYTRGWGHALSASRGFFAEDNTDALFVSRFSNDFLLYMQNRVGYTNGRIERLGLQSQTFWNFNATVDRLHQYWANYAETGPGVRLHLAAMPKSMLLSVSLLRGVYLVNEGNPRRPNYFDVRVGLWYAFTR